jgi:hypothetical protein
MYWTVMTVTTIGYGDLSPQTQSGRIYAIFFIPIGIVMLLKQLSSVAETLFRHKHHQASLTRHCSICLALLVG